MDHMVSRERYPTIDLESGDTTSEEEGHKNPVSSVRQEKSLFGRVWVWGGIENLDRLNKGEEGVRSSNNVPNSSEGSTDDAESLVDKSSGGEENVALLVKKREKEKRRKSGTKKAPKPPRPPRGPSLDAADQKLVKEISELAMLKRERVERMKAQKKKKAAKTASSNSSLCAMVITIFFLLVILFQGMFSRHSSNLSSEGSPGLSAVSGGPFISVRLYKNSAATSSDGLGSESLNLVKQVSGSSPDDEEGTAE